MSPSCRHLGCITLGTVRLLSYMRGGRPYIPGPQRRRRLSADVCVVTGVGASAQENMKSLGTTALLSWVAGEDDDPRVSLD